MQAIARAEDKIQLSRFSEMSEKLFLEATRTLSEISNNISPHILTNFGIKEALRSFVEKITALHPINISMKYYCKKRFGQLIESTLYRVLCELINNSIKHGEATKIELAMVCKNGIIVIDFSDNGKGFDVNKTLKESKGMGLSNISNRIQNIQGVVTFSSAPQKSFAAHIEIAAEAES
jgi:signal transduction histidine kinase